MAATTTIRRLAFFHDFCALSPEGQIDCARWIALRLALERDAPSRASDAGLHHAPQAVMLAAWSSPEDPPASMPEEDHLTAVLAKA